MEYGIIALLLLRKHGPELVNMLSLMIHANMPELRSKDDTNFIRQRLGLDGSGGGFRMAGGGIGAGAVTGGGGGGGNDKVKAKFMEEIDRSLNDWYKRLDNTIHIFVHS